MSHRLLCKSWFWRFFASFSLSMAILPTAVMAEVTFGDFQKTVRGYLERADVDFEEKEALISLTKDLTEQKFQTMHRDYQAVITRLLEGIREYERLSKLGVKDLARQGLDSSLGILAGVMVGAWQADCNLNPRRYALVETAMTDDEISYMASHGVDQMSLAQGASTCIAYGVVKYKRLVQSLQRKKILPQTIKADLRQILEAMHGGTGTPSSAQVAPAPDLPDSGKK